MPTSYPKLRCPICGMVVWLRNLDRIHELDSFIVTYGGRANIDFAKQEYDPNLVHFWIATLESTLEHLKAEAAEAES